jgi:RHS repeat-associated protein
LLARSDQYSAAAWGRHVFYHADGNGNVTYLVDASQALAAKYRYDPFGNTTYSSGTLANANAYRFSSKAAQPNSGLYYYGYRFYDPHFQRWLNRDPIGERRGLNLFTFVRNGVTGHVDMRGLAVWACTRPTEGFPFYGYGRHAYLWDDRSPTAPGMHSCGLEQPYSAPFGGGTVTESSDDGPVGTQLGGPLTSGLDGYSDDGSTYSDGITECSKVPGSEGNEEALMCYCRKNVNKGVGLLPDVRDCHTRIEDMLNECGFPVPPMSRNNSYDQAVREALLEVMLRARL